MIPATQWHIPTFRFGFLYISGAIVTTYANHSRFTRVFRFAHPNQHTIFDCMCTVAHSILVCFCCLFSISLRLMMMVESVSVSRLCLVLLHVYVYACMLSLLHWKIPIESAATATVTAARSSRRVVKDSFRLVSSYMRCCHCYLVLCWPYVNECIGECVPSNWCCICVPVRARVCVFVFNVVHMKSHQCDLMCFFPSWARLNQFATCKMLCVHFCKYNVMQCVLLNIL